MPRAQKLSQLTPNKVYSVEGTLKFVHQSEGYTTAVIQQDSVQKKIKISNTQTQLQEGKNYRFSNCFYNSSGWLMARKPDESIEAIRPPEDQNSVIFFSLKEIHENVESLLSKYFSTFLYVYSIQPKQVLKKDGKDIKFQVFKGYSSGCLVDVTIWNGEIDTDKILNKWVMFEGMRIKKMTEDKFVLASTVFTKIVLCEWKIEDEFNAEIVSSYYNLSEIYQKRKIEELQKMTIPEYKIFSIVKAKVRSIVSVDYEGCPKCRRKIQTHCDYCQIAAKANYSYGKVLLEDGESNLEVIVFDEKIRQLFGLAKENCSIEGKIKTFGRVQDGENVISHILTKIDSIFF